MQFVVFHHLQVYKYEKAIDACDFAVIPEDGQDVKSFSCWVKFQQKDADEEHWLYLNPGFTPLKVEKNTFAVREAFNFCDSCHKITINNKQ